MSDRVRMWCLRHGESENVTAGNAGAVPSAPLTGRGRHQAIQAARALVGQPITGIYSSTALRAQQTAQLLATGSGIVEAIAFNKPNLADHLPRNRLVDACFGLEVDSFQGLQRVRARLRDLRPARAVALSGQPVASAATLSAG